MERIDGSCNGHRWPAVSCSTEYRITYKSRLGTKTIHFFICITNFEYGLIKAHAIVAASRTHSAFSHHFSVKTSHSQEEPTSHSSRLFLSPSSSSFFLGFYPILFVITARVNYSVYWFSTAAVIYFCKPGGGLKQSQLSILQSVGQKSEMGLGLKLTFGQGCVPLGVSMGESIFLRLPDFRGHPHFWFSCSVLTASNVGPRCISCCHLSIHSFLLVKTLSLRTGSRALTN